MKLSAVGRSEYEQSCGGSLTMVLVYWFGVNATALVDGYTG
jgi:hypothetical protein